MNGTVGTDGLRLWPWALAVVMVLVAGWGEWRRVLAVRRWFRRGALERVGWRPRYRTLTTALGIGVVVTGALAVAGWQDAGTGTVWLLVDQSRSLAAVEPDGHTRWQQVQATLVPYVASLTCPVAVIVFRADATVLIPPTRDRHSVQQTLQTLRPILDRQGSDPASAQRLYGRLRHARDTALLISDGEWAAPPPAATVPLVGWGLGSPATVPTVPGEVAAPVSRPDPAAMSALCQGHALWGTAVRPEDLRRLQAEAAASSRTWVAVFLLLALVEAVAVIRRRYVVRWAHLPYRWVQRWVVWRSGTAVVLVLTMLLPAASEVPAWRWRSVASPARQAYNDGCRAAAAGERAAAETAWRRAVALDPRWQPAWYNLGTLLATSPGHVADAIDALEHALRLDPTDAWAAENLRALRSSAAREDQSTASASVPPSRQATADVQNRSDEAPGDATAAPRATSPLDLDALDRAGPDDHPSDRPQALPSLRPGDVDRLLGQAEALSPEALKQLNRRQQDGRPPDGPLPTLTADQWTRLAALAARLGVRAGDVQRRSDPTSPFTEPAAHRPSTLTW